MVPGNVLAIVRRFRKVARTKGHEMTSSQIIMLANGTDSEWSEYLKGPKSNALVRAANLIFALENKEIISMGMQSERWRLVDCADARYEKAKAQMKKATNNIDNARDNLWAIAKDARITQVRRDNAQAWLELFYDNSFQQNLLTLQEWADEIVEGMDADEDTA